MQRHMVSELVNQLRDNSISRRQFLGRASALGISAVAASSIANSVLAQATPSATPVGSPVATPTGVVETISPSREAFNQQLREAFTLETAANTEGSLVYINSSDIDTLNPTMTQDSYTGYVTGALFEPLAASSPIDGSMVPGLADSWDLDADGVTYTFHLNPTVLWHDGTPFTADDVIFTFDSVVAESSLSIRRSTVANALASYSKVDDHTVVFVSNGKLASFLLDTANLIPIVAKHIWGSTPFGEWGAIAANTGEDPTQVVGTGPFKFVSRTIGESIILTRDDNYWDTQNIPSLREFIYRIVPDDNAGVQALRTAEADVVGLPSAQVEPLKSSNPELVISEFDTFSFVYYEFNQDEARGLPMQEIPVRQAMFYALDRQLISDTIFAGLAIPALGTQPVLSPSYTVDKIRTIYNYDPDKANALLDEAGWVLGDDGVRAKDGKRIAFEFQYSESATEYIQLLPYMQQVWGEIGIEMTPVAVPFPTLVDNSVNGTFDCAIFGFSWGVDGSQGDMYRCDAWTPAGFNDMHYCNPQYDELDLQQRQELDPAKRIEIQIELANIINDEQANSVITFSKSAVGSQARLHNFYPNGYGLFWGLQYIWVE